MHKRGSAGSRQSDGQPHTSPYDTSTKLTSLYHRTHNHTLVKKHSDRNDNNYMYYANAYKKNY